MGVSLAVYLYHGLLTLDSENLFQSLDRYAKEITHVDSHLIVIGFCERYFNRSHYLNTYSFSERNLDKTDMV